MTILSPLQSFWQFFRPHAAVARAADEPLVRRINEQAQSLGKRSDRDLRDETAALRWLVEAGAKPTDSAILVPAFALLKEAARRELGIEFYDVQLRAGLALSSGAIAEMQTGEGKTLAAAMPAALYALAGRGVHVVTPNRYLAGRDFELLAPVYRRLGLSAALVEEQVPDSAKRAAYAADISYGTGYEFGFDYLRDQVRLFERPEPELGWRQRDLLRGREPSAPPGVQRGHAIAIIDEIDSVLIDEAGLPLVLSNGADSAAAAELYQAAARAADGLRVDVDFTVDESQRAVRLTEAGKTRAHAQPAGFVPATLDRPWFAYVQQALHARLLLRKDVDYIVDAEKVRIVDNFTGRVFADRSWRNGLQQAVEVKEAVTITPECATAARISRQRYFRLYDTICGMTGTAQGSEREFWSVYRLPVVVIPLRNACRRAIWPTRYFAGAEAKWTAAVAAIAQLHAAGRPVLVGSRTIENSELLARRLTAAGLPHHLLNGRQDQDEAAIVAAAGERGAITIATNMAGRGTDIKLGRGVAELGGLHVLAVEPHEAQRIDRQLIGRAARQGDCGSCQLFVSAEDALLRSHGTHLADQIRRAATADGEAGLDLSAQMTALQRRIEAAAYTERRRLLAYDRWLDEVLATLAKTD